jgi:hypothetical protein
METEMTWLSPSRAVGLSAQFLATTSCFIAWVKSHRKSQSSRLAGWLTVFEALLLADIAFDWRWGLYTFLKDKAAAYGVYEMRRGPQAVALLILAGISAVLIAMAARLLAGRTGAFFAAVGAILSLGSWCSEMISLHTTDALLYLHTGPFMLINYLWVVACVVTSVGILVDANQQRLKR